MRHALALIIGFIFGHLLVGSVVYALGPTTVMFDGSACPAGVYTITATANGQNGDRQQSVPVGVTLPMTDVALSFSNLYAQSYQVSAYSISADGTYYSQPTTVLGLGDPVPTPTPEPTPTPTPSPTPSQTPGPLSPNCTKATTITMPDGVWSVGPHGEVFKNGAWAAPGTISLYKVVDGQLYLLDSAGINWYLLGSSTPLATEPACTQGTPSPTPSPTPTVTPTPTPTPIAIDFSPVLNAIGQQTITLQSALAALTPTPLPTIACTVVSLGTYANGDQKITIRCPSSGIVNGQPLKVIK